ncbi:MAG TPA: hypothetical protein VMP68_14545 [Candidatus Eisenbacteria bacterium]|nr:hypothetical protein [Candidatus Eisenbacteria bacterium]
MSKRPLYEHRLADVLYHIDEGTRVQRPYIRKVVKSRKRKKQHSNPNHMTREAMNAGWKRAAAAFHLENPVLMTLKQPSITPQEWERIDADALDKAKRTLNKPLTHTDKLVGLEFDLLLVWKLSNNTTHGLMRYHCLCACGKHCEKSVGGLLNGRFKDCGHRLSNKKRQKQWRKRQRLARHERKRAFWNMFKYRANKLKKGR